MSRRRGEGGGGGRRKGSTPAVMRKNKKRMRAGEKIAWKSWKVRSKMTMGQWGMPTRKKNLIENLGNRKKYL